jgi:hypothetical protein
MNNRHKKMGYNAAQVLRSRLTSTSIRPSAPKTIVKPEAGRPYCGPRTVVPFCCGKNWTLTEEYDIMSH